MDLQVAGLAITGIVGLVGGGYLIKVYNRIDKVEDEVEKKFVHKDVCKVINAGNEKTLKTMDTKIDSIQKDIKDLLRRNNV